MEHTQTLEMEKLFHTFVAAAAAIVAAILAAWWSSRSTMKNALELQNRERRLEEQSVAALLSADLHGKLIGLAFLLQNANGPNLDKMANDTKVLEAALPRLGRLGHQGAANLLNSFRGISNLAHSKSINDPELAEHTRSVALLIGIVLKTLWERYELDRPETLDKAGIDLEEIGLLQLKTYGL